MPEGRSNLADNLPRIKALGREGGVIKKLPSPWGSGREKRVERQRRTTMPRDPETARRVHLGEKST
ncbi:hypothetical protein K0M31_004313 [Melipona bicolor]|uniref:Uncharacterized protein n=1 Tax=Melipona bicolor TaxID=60889 RepID=A0AA40FWJ5_9HYME|nr:hypothetical protein K0M31_004313 [Melipona bicolor]